MQLVLVNVAWAAVFALVGGILGIAMVLLTLAFLPKLLNHFTPGIDEEKEIARGNQAVAEYFGRVVAAAIIGSSIIIAAAVLAGILAALHG